MIISRNENGYMMDIPKRMVLNIHYIWLSLSKFRSQPVVYKKRIGLLCLIIGGLAWPLGFAIGYKASYILPVHIIFILAGITLRGSHLLNIIRRRKDS